MDHVHRGLDLEFKPSLERRAQCIKMLVDAGFADKIFLSQDSQIGGWLLSEQSKSWREKSPWDPKEGLLFVTRRLIPYLREIGISDHSIDTITVENPRHFFSIS
jgi:predicted metal-dependent phosphotriesterase family hydrolase